MEIREKVFEEREKVYREYQTLPNFTQQRAIAWLRNRWSQLLESFKKAKPHKPINIEVVMNRVAKYMQLGRKIWKELWMPLTF